MWIKFLSLFLSKQSIRYLKKHPDKARSASSDMLSASLIVLIPLFLGFLYYGVYVFIIILCLFITLFIFYLVYSSIFNSEDARQRPEAYDHTAGMGFAITYGLMFIVIFIIVLLVSINFVDTLVYG